MPKILGIWPSLNDLNKNILIEDKNAFLNINTNVEGKFIESMINKRVAYKSILLTPEQLVVKNTFLTYILKISINSLKSYSVSKKRMGSEIEVFFVSENKENFIKFRTNKINEWINEFKKIGLTNRV